jgi:hypothetical protein
MSSRRPRPRRLLLATLIAAVLATEVTGLAIARSMVATPLPLAAVVSAPVAPPAADADATDVTGPGLVVRTRPATPGGTVRPPAQERPAPARAVPAKVVKPSSPRPALAAASYHGRNHVWIPSLGVNRSVKSFPCSRSRPPDAGVYRWGCSGRNNVYLMSHAWSTFKPLHDAYVGGRLKKGMKVWYADGGGTVHVYRVAWWRVTAPTTAASWAWASLSRPGMTLQTCVGADSQYRLMVRLVRVG